MTGALAPQVTVYLHADGADFRSMTGVEIDQALGQLADIIHYAAANASRR